MKRLFIIAILIILIAGVISAQEIETEQQTPFDFWSWLLSQLQVEQFSIVGQARLCEPYPHQSNVVLSTSGGRTVSQQGTSVDYYWAWTNGEQLAITNAKIDEICPSGEALFNIFTQGWIPYKEYRNGVYFTCTSDCKVQVYCCAHPECSLDSNCISWKGTGSECNTAQCVSWKNGGYKCTIEGIVENSIPYQYSSVNYCTASCTGSDINCWRIEGSECAKRTYQCDYATYPSCPSTYPYTSLASCQANIVTPSCSTYTTKSTCEANSNCIWFSGFLWEPAQCIKEGDSICGDGVCDIGENCLQDCTTCGDGICGTGENKDNCPDDCHKKAIGEICSNDMECTSNHCDRSHWYSLSETCQPIPWDELKRIAATRENIKEMTPDDMINIACTQNDNCLASSSNYTVKCIPISTLIDEDVFPSTMKEGFWNKGLERIQTATLGGLAGGTIGGALCVGAGAAIGFLFPPSIPVLVAAGPGVCTAITAGGAIIGATEGLKTPVDTGDKNVIVQKLKAKDANSVGLCVATENPSNSLDFLKFLAFMDIDGDGDKDGTDGLFIGVILLFLIIIVIKR